MFMAKGLDFSLIFARPGHFTPSSTNENALICSCLPKHGAFPKQKDHARTGILTCLRVLSYLSNVHQEVNPES